MSYCPDSYPIPLSKLDVIFFFPPNQHFRISCLCKNNVCVLPLLYSACTYRCSRAWGPTSAHVRVPLDIFTQVFPAYVQWQLVGTVLLLAKHRRLPAQHKRHSENNLQLLNECKFFSDWTRWRLWSHLSSSPPCPIRECFATPKVLP